MKHKSIFTLFLEFLRGIFFTDISNWIESSKTQGLREVEKQFIYRYMNKMILFFIHKEQKKYKYSVKNFCFGEIPYLAAKDICKTVSLNKNDILYDLGCGRGKFLFFSRLFTGARCIGIDLIPTYINISNKIIEDLNISRLELYQGDIQNVNLKTASVVIIHGTTFSQKTHDSIWNNIFSLKAGSRFISISIYYDHPKLELFEKKDYNLSWGRSTAYFYKVKT